MGKAARGLCALALVIGLAAACTDSSRDRIGEGKSDRTPSTAQPTPPTDNAQSGATAATPGAPSTASGARSN